MYHLSAEFISFIEGDSSATTSSFTPDTTPPTMDLKAPHHPPLTVEMDTCRTHTSLMCPIRDSYPDRITGYQLTLLTANHQISRRNHSLVTYLLPNSVALLPTFASCPRNPPRPPPRGAPPRGGRPSHDTLMLPQQPFHHTLMLPLHTPCGRRHQPPRVHP